MTRISDKEIFTEENQGRITLETGGTTRFELGVSGAFALSGNTTIAASGGSIGHFGSTPVPVQSATATTGAFTAGTGTAAVSGSSWVGTTGSKSYSMSDVVTALKNYNLLTP